MSNKITRRDFIKATGSAVALASTPAILRAAPKKYDAIVIGAGLAGLHAAMLLEEGGLNVLMLEGRNRLGGRVYTLMDVPGKPEAAGEWVGANYARMIATAKKLNLDFFTPPASTGLDRGWAYKINGQFLTQKEWTDHPLNPTVGDDRKIPPHRLLSNITNKDNPLRGKPLDAWLQPEFQKYDIPFDQYLRSLGYDDETMRLMDVTIHTSHMQKTSALHELRRYHVNEFNSKLSFDDGTSYKQIKGGNSLMPEAMANTLKNEVLLNKTVVHFEQTDKAVTVYCSDGTNYTAEHVVSSIPLSVLRDITFSPRLPGVIQGAVDEVDYGTSIQAHYLINKPYWEEDGMAPSIWADGSIERFGARNTEKGQQAAGVAFINGEAADKYRLMTDAEIFKYVELELVKLRPSMKGVLEPLSIQSCERDIHGAGDWVYWQPGQVTKYGNNMREKHGRIHFCGEHTAIMERGMEGAFESGERAALDILFA